MYLDAASPLVEPEYEIDVIGGDDVIYRSWEHWPAAELSHHGQICCEIAKEWVLATDVSYANGGSDLAGPRWLRQRFEWGPTRYPIYWCEIGQANALDCGVHAALAEEIFNARGKKCFRAQMVQEYSREAAEQWKLRWKGRDAVTTWIDGILIYHEGCAVVSGENDLKLWDASAGWWVDGETTSGYGSLRALRVTDPIGNYEFNWEGRTLPANRWIVTAKDDLPPTSAAIRANRTYGSAQPLPVRVRLRSV